MSAQISSPENVRVERGRRGSTRNKDLAEGRDGSQSIDLHSGVSKLGESSHPMMNNNHTSDTLVGHNKEYLDKSILDDSSYHNTEYDNINLKKLGGGVPARFSPFDDSEMNTGAYKNSNSGVVMESDSVGNSGNTIRLQKSKRLSKLKDIINDNNFDKKNDDYRELDNAGRVSEESTDFVDDQEFFFNDGQQYISPAKAPLSTYSTVLLYICVGMTSGALQLPFAFSTGGWFTIFIIFFTGIVSIISGAMVFQCVQFNQGPSARNLHDVAKLAFGRSGYIFTLFIDNIYIISSCVSFLNVIGAISTKLFSVNHESLDVRLWMLIFSTGVLFLFVVFKRFINFAKIGVLGGIFAVIAMIMLAIMGFTIRGNFDFTSVLEAYYDQSRIRISSTNSPIPNTTFISIRFPVTLGCAAYAFGGTPIHPIIQQNMLFPKSWPVVLLFGSLAMSVVYALFGSGIYYYIGDGGSIANVPYQHPYNPLTIATYPFILFHAIIMVPIYFYVISFDWETAFNMHRIVVARRAVSLKILRIALRSCLWLGVLFCAVVIPRSFAVFNTLSIFSSSFALYIIPAACYLHLYGWRSCNIVEKIGSVVVIFVGISTLIFGTLGSLLYVLYGSRSNPQF